MQEFLNAYEPNMLDPFFDRLGVNPDPFSYSGMNSPPLSIYCKSSRSFVCPSNPDWFAGNKPLPFPLAYTLPLFSI